MGPQTVYAVIALTFLVITSSSDTDAAKSCNLRWNSDLPSWFPLIWNNSEIVYPNDVGGANWTIQIPPKTSLSFGCSETQNTLKKFNLPEITIICNARGQFKVGKNAVAFSELGCTNPLKEKVVKLSGSCSDGSDNVTIQFQSSTNNFQLINICHNADLEETVMAHHIVRGDALNPFEVSNKRPSFKEGQYYKKISVNTAYSQKSQLDVVSKLVGSSTLGKQYINPSKSFYFARGHLAPDGDFVHIYEQNATYYFINVVPQWQSINNGNWKGLEVAVRKYATVKDVDLKIWTGGKGVLKLTNNDGNPVEIYLAADSSKKKLLLPAPELSWKVIQDPERNAAVAIFMINNPHLTNATQVQELILCPDICTQISWVTWKTEDIQKGYTYCCDINSAKRVLKNIPDFGKSVQLLT